MRDHFTLTSSALPPETRVASFKGVEAISRPYEFEVNLLIPDTDLELADVIGDKVTLTIQPESGFVMNGVVATLELLAEEGDYGLFRATIVPKLWYLTLTRHSRVFTNESVIDVIEKVLKSNDFTSSDYELRLRGSHAKLEHVCQYKESDFDFISRWMEREGLYYFFEQGDDEEKLVITDDRSFQDALSTDPVRFRGRMGADVTAGASLDTFVCRHTTLPTKVALKDYDHLKPKLDVSGTAPVSSKGMGEIHVYGENFATPDDGKRLAKIRAEELLARETIYKGDGRVYGLRAGYTFTLDEHPRASFNTEYLAIAVRHWGNQSAGSSSIAGLLELEYDEPYHVNVEAIPAKVQFRAARTTPVPRIYGTEEGVVDAESGDLYAEIDPHGRYKVKIFFDESDLEDGNASTWVRMLQPHGGDVEGFHFPLRKGTEVHLVFLGGDPDRPVIAGVAHNAHNPSAVTASNNTRNVVQTGGRNRIEMEDREGSQWMHMRTEPKSTFFFMGAVGGSDSGKGEGDEHPHEDEYNVHVSTDGTGKIFTGHTFDILTEHGPMSIKVEGGGNFLHQVSGTVTEHFEQTVTQTYGHRHELRVEAGGRFDEVTGDFHQEVHGGYRLAVEGGWGHVQAVGPQWVVNVEGPWHHTARLVDWNIEEEVKIRAGGKIEFECMDLGTTRHGNHFEFTVGTSQEIKLGSFTDITIGNKNEVTLAVVSDILVGGGLEVVIAGMAEFKTATHLELRGGPHLENESAHIKHLTAEIKKLDTRIEDAEADIKCNEFMIEQLSLKVYA